MTDSWLTSGNAALDEVLGGGLPAQGISLIMGLPGAGKTIIAQQYAFHNADPQRPVVYFSTVSEPLEKIVRFGQTLDFFDVSAVGKSVFYEDLGQTVGNDGLSGIAEQIAVTLRQRRPGLVIIDSFKALQAFADNNADFRRFLHELAGRLTAFPAASLWIGEYEPADAALLPEFAVVDAIVELATVRVGQRDMRFLRSGNCAAAASGLASTPTGSASTACTYSPASPMCQQGQRMHSARSGSAPASAP